ncbi:MAG: iron-sulfur cluster repair di-iron protein [Chitinophagaceae bacterium]|nr:iron-sulfur cluster repair di-iron protein [Sphingobacteriales bacterium]OJW01266.1 MAG: iron-sulfur cluster repair di-iron protein [Sphingobacteriales bacterium 44-61]TXJ22460.1 MAG: iron-sulfur cluster repair di-iron protein [Chitinophagaceae bacterium]
MTISKENIVGLVVADDFRTAGIFEQAGIDFCCNGNRTIEAACNEKKLSVDELIGQLQQTINTLPPTEAAISDYKSWPLDLLADFIEKKHHRYVTTQIPVIQSFLEKIVKVHGGRHPELAEIKTHFDACAGELAVHMKKEELMVFPFIRKMVQAKQAGATEVAATPFGTVQNPIRVMMHEHDTEGERFRKIKELSNQYNAPADGCNTYKAAFATLKDFEDDLHLHIHLENNILFPKSIELEKSFA